MVLKRTYETTLLLGIPLPLLIDCYTS